MMEATALFGEPQEHGLVYCSVFLQELAKQMPGNIAVVQTDGTVAENDSAMAAIPKIFYHAGHGNYNRFTVECRTNYIDVETGERLDDFKDKIVHLLSCETGMSLGPSLVKHGATAFLGYDEVFYYGVIEETKPDPEPYTTPTNYCDYYSFIDCDVEVERQFLIKGKSLKQAVAVSQKKFDEYITKYSTGIWKDTYVAPYMVRFLRHDKINQVTYGNINVTATGEEVPVEEEEEYWDPLRWIITTFEGKRPPIPVAVLENLVSDTASNIIKYAPELKLRR